MNPARLIRFLLNLSSRLEEDYIRVCACVSRRVQMIITGNFSSKFNYLLFSSLFLFLAITTTTAAAAASTFTTITAAACTITLIIIIIIVIVVRIIVYFTFHFRFRFLVVFRGLIGIVTLATNRFTIIVNNIIIDRIFRCCCCSRCSLRLLLLGFVLFLLLHIFFAFTIGHFLILFLIFTRIFLSRRRPQYEYILTNRIL